MRGRVLAVLALVLVVAVVVASTVSWWSHRQVPKVVDAACPPLLTNTSNAADDYGDTVQSGGRTWWRTEGRTRADTGLPAGVVTCSIAEMANEDGWRVAPGGWADGTATVLPRGTRLYPPSEDRAGEALVASTPGGDLLYCPDAPGTC